MERVRSFSGPPRYPANTPPEMPGPIGEDYDYGTHHLDGPRPRDPVQVLKACACYEYQSSESPDWDGGEAEGFIASLRRDAIRALPGFEDAVWGSPPPYTHLDPKEAARRVAARK